MVPNLKYVGASPTHWATTTLETTMERTRGARHAPRLQATSIAAGKYAK